MNVSDWALGQQALVLFSVFGGIMGGLVFVAWWFFCPPLKEEDLSP